MKILVTVKRIPDPDESLKFSGDTLDLSSSKFVANAFDEYALETALRLAEKAGTKERFAEVVVLSVCPKDKRQHVTQFLAMGAERGIVVDADDSSLDTAAISKAIAAVVDKEQPDLVITGKLSQDNEGNQIGQRVAALTNRPQASFAAAINWDQEGKKLIVEREVDDGVETKVVPLPAVVSVDLRVVLPSSVKNGVTPDDHKYQEGPRLASLRGITMAKRKKVDTYSLDELGVASAAGEKVVGVTQPPARARGQMVSSVEELVEKLATEAKVL